MTTNPYTVTELATMWEREQLSPEQMIGQILAHISLLQQALNTLITQPATTIQALDIRAQRPNARRSRQPKDTTKC